MIKVEKVNDFITVEIYGHSDNILCELHVLLKHILKHFHTHGQELLVLDEITDVVSEFADDHKTNTKGDKLC